MSCRACDEFAETPVEIRGQYFYRWKHASVEIVACAEHVKEIMEALNKTQNEFD